MEHGTSAGSVSAPTGHALPPAGPPLALAPNASSAPAGSPSVISFRTAAGGTLQQYKRPRSASAVHGGSHGILDDVIAQLESHTAATHLFALASLFG